MSPGRSRDELAVDQYVKLHDELLSFTAVPSLRAALHRFDDRDAVLTLITHHLFGDNWSAGILRREFSACYKARVSGTPHALPIPVQYREFVTWEQEFLQSDKAAKARNFWTEKLAGAEMYTMPADRPHGPDTLTPRSAVSNFLIDAHDFAKVIASARQNRCTPWHLLVAASMVLAERIRGSSNITLLSVDNGRQVRDFHNTIGFFANLVPIRLDFGNCRSFRDLMLDARKASMDAHQHQIPFGTVLELAPELMRSFEDSQVAPIAFNYARASVTLSDIQFADRVESVPWPEDLPTMFHRGSCMWSLVLLPSGAFRCVIEYEPDMLGRGHGPSAGARTSSAWFWRLLIVQMGPGRPSSHRHGARVGARPARTGFDVEHQVLDLVDSAALAASAAASVNLLVGSRRPEQKWRPVEHGDMDMCWQ
ncbi:condensation domain-containing protein [Salinispora arenicola]|uniref:condensation domain-containing protein n=1 Tax=Salinispora arenicola TaxID=168697 RepID=UPI0027DB952E|nr:condensation domain-containing protein [Salinispora arenicola]